MIWFYSQNQKRSSDFFRNVMSCRIELCEKAPKNDNKNGIWSGHALSSSYAILFFMDIYWISLFLWNKYKHTSTPSCYADIAWGYMRTYTKQISVLSFYPSESEFGEDESKKRFLYANPAISPVENHKYMFCNTLQTFW